MGEAGVVAIFSLRMHNGEQTVVFGDGEQTRELIYVDDVVRAFLAAADSDAEGRYNVGTGLETSVWELGEALAPLCRRDAFEPEMQPAQAGEIQRIVTSSEPAAETLGWRPEIELDDGLQRTVAALAADAQAAH